jgi:hypothetical protein
VGGDVPEQQFIDPVDRMLRDVGEHVTQIGFRVDIVELGVPMSE